jgi:cytochrome c oxidase subunit 3
MIALPAAAKPAQRRQLLVGTALVCAAGTTLFFGMMALYLRFRQDALAQPEGEWRPNDVLIPEVPTNVMLIAFIGVFVFAQWAVYAARRQHTTYTALALALTALMGVAIINAQAFVYTQLGLGLRDGTYSMFVYALTGTFVVYAIIGVVFSLVTIFRYMGGRTGDRDVVAAHAIYWYFLGAIYAALWFVVYVTK